MSSVRLTVVSDSHLSPKTPEATENWEVFTAHANELGADAVVHVGDIAMNGTDDVDDLRYARSKLDELSPQLLAVPGNHDLGDNPCETNSGSTGLITEARLAAYRDHVGADRWSHDLGPWRLVGFNAQLVGSDLAAEAEQWVWLEDELNPTRVGGRPLAFFSHKPLFHSLPQPAEHDEPIRYLRPPGRERLLRLLETASARLVVSGHVHQFRRFHVGGIEHLWCPTSWATLSPETQSTIGERWVGGLDLVLSSDGSIEVKPFGPPVMAQHVIGSTVPNPYRAH